MHAQVKFLIFGFCLFVFTLSMGQDKEKDKDIKPEKIPLDQLLQTKPSTGSLVDLDIEQLPVSITVISNEQIRNSGARHLSELLEIYVPGFQYMYNKWNGIIWGMRGVASDRNTKFIFLVNGRKMNEESRDGAYSELDLGFLSDLERVEVLRGPAGLLYGSGSIAGVINLITKKLALHSSSGDSTVSESMAETWSMRTFGASQKVLFSQRLSDNSYFQFYAGFRWSEGTGVGTPRIWGRPSWPYPQDTSGGPPSADGVAPEGTSWSTPGNFILSADYQVKKWRAYGRITRQVTNASGFFPLDPWPDTVGVLGAGSNVPAAWVDGKRTGPGSVYGRTESWGDNRRQYKVSGISLQINYSDTVSKNNLLKLNAGGDLVSNEIGRQRIGYVSNTQVAGMDRDPIEAFGEKRFNFTGTYLINRNTGDRPCRYQVAMGIDSRLFIFGKDLAGRNELYGSSMHRIIYNGINSNQAVFAEGVIYPARRLMFDMGGRIDVITRKTKYWKLPSARVGMVYNLDSSFSLRAVWQSSGNNASADNYAFNKNYIDDNGNAYSGPHYEHPDRTPDGGTPVIEKITIDSLRNLKPERANSLEVSGLYQRQRLIVYGSVSYNTISNLFTWYQSSFRVRNAGKYHFINGEFDLHYNSPGSRWTVGVNHVISKLVDTEVKEGKLVRIQGVYTPKPDNQGNYIPDKIRDTLIVTYPVRDAISADGKNFLNLASNVTKVYTDFALTPHISVHSDWRLFWGLRGRQRIHADTAGFKDDLEDMKGSFKYGNAYPYLGVERKLMVKWNLGISFAWKNALFQFFVYDILSPQSNKRNVNAIRWQQMSNSKLYTDLYAVDFRSYAVKVTLGF